jgi:hypothetical protein
VWGLDSLLSGGPCYIIHELSVELKFLRLEENRYYLPLEGWVDLWDSRLWI